ncbi:glycoside hydrolase family 2 TIM barrel-domain containing protein [Humibacter antri]
MTRIAFDDDWTLRPKTSIFAQLGGPQETPVKVRLPHDALIGMERTVDGLGKSAYYPRSAAFEYSKEFRVPAEWSGKRVSLELDGAYRDAVVFVNNARVGQRPYGYTPFVLSLDDHLDYDADNVLRVEVRAHDDSRWYTGVGITRGATLIVDELVHITPYGVRVSTPDVDDERAVVEIAVEVANASIGRRTVSVEAEVTDADGTVVAVGSAPVTLRSGGTELARVRTYVPSPDLWNVDAPTLYTVRLRLTESGETLQEREQRFGIRTLRLDPVHGLRINGASVKLRGACIHHDNGPLGAAAFSRADERRVELLKQAGFNAIRSAHNPISGAMLDACDRLGMLVMDETFDIWTESKSSFDYSLAFEDWWERDVEAMVARDYNHPSVVFYSIGNEIPEVGNPLGSQIGRRIAEKIRSLDRTRFVTNALNGFVATITDVMAMMRERGAQSVSGGVNDAMGAAADLMNRVTVSPLVTAKLAESFGVLDVVGLNYGDARYESDRELFPNQVIVGTETYAQHIDVLWDLVTRNGHVIGDFTWTGWDYLGEVGIGRPRYADAPAEFEAPYPWRTAWCGDIDITGNRRTISYYRETVYGLRHEPYIAVHRPETYGRTAPVSGWAWTDSLGSWTWSVEDGTHVTVDVYSDTEEIELVLNGAAVGRAAVGRVTDGDERAFQARFHVAYEPGELVAIARTAGVEVARTTLVSASGAASLSVEVDRTTVSDDTGDLAFVTVELRDAAGVLVTDADRLVGVEVEGAGVLQALGSARPDSAEPFAATECETFDGRALAIIRPTGAGEVTVRARCEGLEDVERTIVVSPAAVPEYA